MTTPRIDYDFAVLRVVPRVHLGAFVNVGVVVHARTAEFLALRVIDDESALAGCVSGVDVTLLARYLRSCVAICAGDASAGEYAATRRGDHHHRGFALGGCEGRWLRRTCGDSANFVRIAAARKVSNGRW